MEQKVPDISNADIKRIIQRDFSGKDFLTIKSILDLYTSETERGTNRVHASILKLSAGNIESLIDLTKKAVIDFRDIVSQSEYPKYSQYVFNEHINESEKRELIEDDWEQYQHWLHGE